MNGFFDLLKGCLHWIGLPLILVTAWIIDRCIPSLQRVEFFQEKTLTVSGILTILFFIFLVWLILSG